jgi:nudix-type nucleoside diphosphatase (YffH/AdpP family)
LSGRDFFFYGTLCHLPLLEVVLGRQPRVQAARLPDHAVFWAEGGAFPLLQPAPGQGADGVLVSGLDAQDEARLDFYEAGFAFRTACLAVSTPVGPREALVYLPDPGHWAPGALWDLAQWQRLWGDTVTETAGDFMALMGEHPPARVLARYANMLVRGASRVRARESGPARLRLDAGPGDLRIAARRTPYANYFAVEEYDLSHRRFDGAMSPVITRAAFISGDAVTVLPYDPARDRVLLVEQFRAGPLARGDRQCWQLEPVAGRIDPDETPEAAARREAVEEAGLTLGRLLKVAEYYPTTGAKSEYLYSYVALADLPDGVAGIHGVADEAEDIRGHLVSFDAFMALVASGEISNAPLILTALWLQRERPGLRAEAQG